mmetsp:Transcript_18178/g.29047  ORF Transcript_18178/g.29047 Transcript_18178/m.29047 type:complete len:301 (+) Transcript_18178:69-971(+)
MSEPDRSALSQSFSRQVLGLLVGDVPDPEQQPLLQQAPSYADNRQRFEQNRRAAAQGLLLGSICLIGIAAFAFIAWVLVSIILYLHGWSVLSLYMGQECDQPLNAWLLITLLVPLFNSLLSCLHGRNRGCKVLSWMSSLGVLIAGIIFLRQSKTCAKTNPHLYNFARTYVTFLSVSWSCMLAVPSIAILVIIFGIRYGWFESQSGASPETISSIETVAYDAELFAKDGMMDDNRPTPECCCCCETFGAEKHIKRTPCQHYFHEECLGHWLKVAVTCPICRADLEEAVYEKDLEKGRAGQA